MCVLLGFGAFGIPVVWDIGMAVLGLLRSLTPMREVDARLQMAAYRGDLEEVADALADGAEVNAVDRRGRSTALGRASLAGHVKVVSFLLERGADANKCCPIYYAAERNQVEVATVLLSHGADPNRFTNDGVPSALLVASELGHVAMVTLLLSKGTIIGPRRTERTAIGQAAAGGHLDAVKVLLASGCALGDKDASGHTPLHRAAMHGRMELCDYLLKQGADPRCKNDAGETAHDLARRSNHGDVVALLEKGGK